MAWQSTVRLGAASRSRRGALGYGAVSRGGRGLLGCAEVGEGPVGRGLAVKLWSGLEPLVGQGLVSLGGRGLARLCTVSLGEAVALRCVGV